MIFGIIDINSNVTANNRLKLTAPATFLRRPAAPPERQAHFLRDQRELTGTGIIRIVYV